MTEETKTVETINVTPTWRGILPLLLTGYADGTPKGRAIAFAELQRMADLADRYADEHKEGKPDEVTK